MIIVGAVVCACISNKLFEPRDYTKDYITMGVCPKCKNFDKYSQRCFAPEHSRYSKRLEYTVYYGNEPRDNKSSCYDYCPEKRKMKDGLNN